ncbi:MAG: hypothetical protein VKJ06_07690 [Vampirovibrionales bacterium]|nr:hypothetical protein [Vampirovibrionales bacterium]
MSTNLNGTVNAKTLASLIKSVNGNAASGTKSVSASSTNAFSAMGTKQESHNAGFDPIGWISNKASEAMDDVQDFAKDVAKNPLKTVKNAFETVSDTVENAQHHVTEMAQDVKKEVLADVKAVKHEIKKDLKEASVLASNAFAGKLNLGTTLPKAAANVKPDGDKAAQNPVKRWFSSVKNSVLGTVSKTIASIGQPKATESEDAQTASTGSSSGSASKSNAKANKNVAAAKHQAESVLAKAKSGQVNRGQLANAIQALQAAIPSTSSDDNSHWQLLTTLSDAKSAQQQLDKTTAHTA